MQNTAATEPIPEPIPRDLGQNHARAVDLRRTALPLAVLLASFALLYWRALVKVVHEWATDDNYSHGNLIRP